MHRPDDRRVSGSRFCRRAGDQLRRQQPCAAFRPVRKNSMIAMLADLKHGLRVLVRTPLFTICTIAALAIGIGATTALFSVVHAMLLKPLPYPNSDSLVVIWEHNLPRDRARNVVSPANFLAWKERSRSFQGMAAFTQSRVTLTGNGEPQEL